MAAQIGYNAVLANIRPFPEIYTKLQHYTNELAFFVVVLVCMSFTDIMTDIPTRNFTAFGLNNFVFVILGLNVIVCLVGVILSKKHLILSAPVKEKKRVSSAEKQVKPHNE